MANGAAKPTSPLESTRPKPAPGQFGQHWVSTVGVLSVVLFESANPKIYHRRRPCGTAEEALLRSGYALPSQALLPPLSVPLGVR
jgi:hypothetical protein